MKTTNIRGLRHDTTTVLGWVAGGESVEIQRRGMPVAFLSPRNPAKRIIKPDFLGRMRTAYGDKILSTSATDLVSESRGER
jgi:antitoxin (DNA-binding transcriptional repressor) of toxin-antitoxin stability system